jgi:hypothetical protein
VIIRLTRSVWQRRFSLETDNEPLISKTRISLSAAAVALISEQFDQSTFKYQKKRTSEKNEATFVH